MLKLISFSVSLLCLLHTATCRAEQTWESFSQPGRFTTAACASNGFIYVTTEDRGLWCGDLSADLSKDSNWKQVALNEWANTGDSYRMALYAVCPDRFGNIWTGTLNQGVSVGDQSGGWKTFGIMEGCPGLRVSDVRCCPKNGDIWIASSSGLAVHSPSDSRWSPVRQVEGVPSCICFDDAGSVYVGTQCNGVFIADAPNYSIWRNAGGPDRPGVIPFGSGLPTSQINHLLAASDGTVYAATNAGLASSRDRGRTWSYIRGRDYADKVRGLLGGPPKNWKPYDSMSKLLPEDCVTSIEEDGGLLLLGFKDRGMMTKNMKTGETLLLNKENGLLPDNFVKAVLPTGDGRPFICTYGGGLVRLKTPLFKASGVRKAGHAVQDAQFPMPAEPPTEKEVDAMISRASSAPALRQQAASLPGDWWTQGHRLGRPYGKIGLVMFGYCSPYDAHEGEICYHRYMGGNHQPGDSIRAWIQWKFTNNPRCLEIPIHIFANEVGAGKARPEEDSTETEIDDHGESGYARSFDGPHNMIDIFVPAGWHVVSLYFYNKDGQEGDNRTRDYMVYVKESAGPPSDRYYMTPEEQIAFDRRPVLARSRVIDFWGGVYARFAVKGPGWHTFQVNRNYSLNAIVCAAFLDPVEQGSGLPELETPATHASGINAKADRLFDLLQQARARNPSWYAWEGSEMLAALARHYRQRGASVVLGGEVDRKLVERLAVCFRDLHLFESWEKAFSVVGAQSPREKCLQLRSQLCNGNGQ